MISVAIDGPAGAGKSTIARAVAQKLGFLYVDTGALYRTIGLAVRRAGKDPSRPEDAAECLPAIRLELGYEEGVQQVYLNGENVSTAIRTPQASMDASAVSAIPAVREFLLEQQREIARKNNVIMDGRDIGTVILPHAEVKIFLTASPEERARRRFEELIAKGESVSYENVLEDVKQRDYQDSHRAAAPLKQAEDAVLADTTGLELAQSIALLEQIIRDGIRRKEAQP
ncbi:MAG: (d)CMP kinase [Candidatus Merdivicinus sp.]